MKCYTQRSRFIVSITIFFVFSMMFAFSGGNQEASADKTYSFRMADHYSLTNTNTRLFIVPFKERVEELSKGQVKITHYPMAQLAKQAAMISSLKTKVIDLGFVTPLSFAGELPLNTGIALPGMYSTADEGTNMYQKALKSGPLHDEFVQNGMKPIFGYMITPYELDTKKSVIKLEDVKGMKIRVSGGPLANVARALGAVPVQIGGAECYTSLERGIVDGAIFTLESIPDYGFDEVTKFATQGAALGCFPSVMAMRLDLWNELPQEIKDIFLKASDEIIDGSKFDAQEQKQIEAIKTRGLLKINVLSAEERAKFRAAVKPVRDEWMAEMKDKGLDGQAVLDVIQIEK